MTQSIKDLIVTYGIIAGRRFYKKEKIKYIQLLNEYAVSLGYKTSLLFPENSKGSATNLLIGDVKNAKTILLASYDTPPKSFGLSKYEPFNYNKNRKIYYLSVFLPLIFVSILTFIFTISFMQFNWLSAPLSTWHLLVIIVYGIMIYLIIHFSKGVPNAKNMNRNSSGIVSILHYMQSHQHQSNVAYVFLDHGASNHMGSMMLKEYLTPELEKSKKFIMLDSVGIGNTFGLCVHNYTLNQKQLSQTTTKKCVLYNTDANHFSISTMYTHCITLSCTSDPKPPSFVVPNVSTSKDRDIDVGCIEEINKVLELLTI